MLMHISTSSNISIVHKKTSRRHVTDLGTSDRGGYEYNACCKPFYFSNGPISVPAGEGDVKPVTCAWLVAGADVDPLVQVPRVVLHDYYSDRVHECMACQLYS